MIGTVDIVMRKDGRVLETRHGRNVWVGMGREYLAHLVPLLSYDPDVPYEDRRVRYMGFGIGSDRQQQLGMANTPPIGTAYPGTNTYNKDYPIDPLIITLERPVRISGGSTPYPGVGTDVWLKEPPPPGFMTVFPVGTGEVIFRSLIDGTLTGSNDIVYPPFTQMPLSEVGLFLSDADVNVPFGQLVAYFSFVTIVFPVGAQLEVSWKVRFGCA